MLLQLRLIDPLGPPGDALVISQKKPLSGTLCSNGFAKSPCCFAGCTRREIINAPAIGHMNTGKLSTMTSVYIYQTRPWDIKSLRQTLNVSQREVALMAGVNVRTLQNWEQDRRKSVMFHRRAGRG